MIVAAAACGRARGAVARRGDRSLVARKSATHSMARLESGPPVVNGATPPDLRVLGRSASWRCQGAIGSRTRPPSRNRGGCVLGLDRRSLAAALANASSDACTLGRAAAASIGDALLVVFVGLLLTFVVVRLLMNFQLARSGARLRESTPLEGRPSPRALYNEACAAASRGDYGAARRLLLFAATSRCSTGRAPSKRARARRLEICAARCADATRP